MNSYINMPNMTPEEYKTLLNRVQFTVFKYDVDRFCDNRFYIHTPCGELKVIVDVYDGTKSGQWISTKLNFLGNLPDRVKEIEHFNLWSGRYGKCSNSVDDLVEWLDNYLKILNDDSVCT